MNLKVIYRDRLIIVFIIAMLTSQLFSWLSPVIAQRVVGAAHNIKIDDADAKPGDILSIVGGKILRASRPYDSGMIGVIAQYPIISYGDNSGTVPVVTESEVDVRVTAKPDAISVGDFITSSDKPGVGMKANISGFVLGKALADYKNTSQDGTIPVLVNIGVFAQNPNVSGLLGQLANAISIGLASAQNFPLILRYISAALMGIVTMVFSSFSFVRFMRSGLEAIGRNPLARSTIIAGMLVNGAIVLVLTLVGLGIAVAIIAF